MEQLGTLHEHVRHVYTLCKTRRGMYNNWRAMQAFIHKQRLDVLLLSLLVDGMSVGGPDCVRHLSSVDKCSRRPGMQLAVLFNGCYNSYRGDDASCYCS